MKRTLLLALLPLFSGCLCEKSDAEKPGHANAVRPRSDPSAAIAQASAVVALAKTRSQGILNFTGTPVFVGSEAVFAGVKQARVMGLPSDASPGFPADQKPSGASSLQVPSLATALKRHREANGRALVFFDTSTPYRIVAEILAALDGAGYLFWTLVGEDEKGAHRVVLSSRSGDPTVWLLMSDEGARVVLPKGTVAPGCTAVGSGIAIPAAPRGGLDVDALTACTSRWSELDSSLTRDSIVAVVPKALSYGELVTVLDAVRTGYPRLRLGVSGATDGTRSLVTSAPK